MKETSTKRKGPGGQKPPSYTPELWQRFLEEVSSGRSVRDICDNVPGMPGKSTTWRWINSDPERAAQYDRAHAAGLELIMEEILDLADDLPEDPSAGQVAKRKLQVNTRQWVASKLLPKKYGDRMDTTMTLTVDHESVLMAGIERMLKARDGLAKS